jgi:hypothetical protein
LYVGNEVGADTELGNEPLDTDRKDTRRKNVG